MLPSLADILLVVVLLVPGFIAFIIFKKIAIRHAKLSDLEITIYSLLCSLMIYVVFGFITGVTNIDEIRDNIFIPQNLFLILAFAVVPGIGIGYLARVLFRRGISEGDCWEKCFAATRKCGSHALIYTTDGKEYKGVVCIAGIGEDSPKEVVLNNPKLILRDKNFRILSEIINGKVMLFKESDVRRVVFLDDIAP